MTKQPFKSVVGLESRGTQVDIEKCAENAGNMFDLVIAMSARAREIKRLNKHSPHREHQYPVITSLLELQSGQITK